MATRRLGARKGPSHDHVNMGQSTNDVIPTTMRLAALCMSRRLVEAVDALAVTFKGKAGSLGRSTVGPDPSTDAAPVTWANSARTPHASSVFPLVKEGRLELQGIGDRRFGRRHGPHTHRDYPRLMAAALSRQTGSAQGASEPLRAMQSMAPFTHLSGLVRNLALGPDPHRHDFRLMTSGPPPGSVSFYCPPPTGKFHHAGKVNPVMAECLDMVCCQVWATTPR